MRCVCHGVQHPVPPDRIRCGDALPRAGGPRGRARALGGCARRCYGEVLLRGDVLGHRLVDVEQPRLVTAHDVQGTGTGNGWVATAVDIHSRGLLRRLRTAAQPVGEPGARSWSCPAEARSPRDVEQSPRAVDRKRVS